MHTKAPYTGDMQALVSSLSPMTGFVDRSSALQGADVVLTNIDVVPLISGAAKLCAKGEVIKAQDDLSAKASACLTDVVNRGLVIAGRLEAQGKSAGSDLVQDEVLSLRFLLLELADLRFQLIVLRGELRSLLADSEEAASHVR